MKIINLGRGQGKTTRLLYASEFNNMPILCSTFKQKDELIDNARKLGLKIPEPIVVSELMTSRIQSSHATYKDLLVDEAPMVLQALLKQFGMHGEVKAITLTEKDKYEIQDESVKRNICGSRWLVE